MTMIERSARAIQTALFNPALGVSVSIEGDAQRLYEAFARAVLQAIREPSEAMKAEGCAKGVNMTDNDSWDHIYAEMTWQAMIDAALEEG